MRCTMLLEEYLRPLLEGERAVCRRFVQSQLTQAESAETLYYDLLWPAMEQVNRLFRADRINTLTEHMATRINRTVADQLQTALPIQPTNGRQIILVCADGEAEELGAQMCADLFECRGWKVFFVGGGVPQDEILQMAGTIRPDVLMIYGTQPNGVPGVRRLVDLIREVGINPSMNILVSGGVFDRAEGLWKEVCADLYAENIREAIAIAEAAPPRNPPQLKPGAAKKRRRRRKPQPEEANA